MNNPAFGLLYATNQFINLFAIPYVSSTTLFDNHAAVYSI